MPSETSLTSHPSGMILLEENGKRGGESDPEINAFSRQYMDPIYLYINFFVITFVFVIESLRFLQLSNQNNISW